MTYLIFNKETGEVIDTAFIEDLDKFLKTNPTLHVEEIDIEDTLEDFQEDISEDAELY
jgi:hypothetical protein